MTRLQVGVGLVVALLGLAVAWIGANLSADFADLGSVAFDYGDDGSIPAFVLIPIGVVVAASGITVAALALSRRARP